MAKDEFIGVRVSKELKEKLQKEAKEKGMSLSQYFESQIRGDFWESKYIVQSLIEDAKENEPEHWREARKSPINSQLEWHIPIFVSDFVKPQGTPRGMELHMSYLITEMLRVCANNLDSVNERMRGGVADNLLSAGHSVADNLGKIKNSEKEYPEDIIRKIRELIEKFAFNYASMAFDKESYEAIKKALDKIEHQLLENLKEETD